MKLRIVPLHRMESNRIELNLTPTLSSYFTNMYRLGDLSGLLLLHSAAGDREGMKSLALKAQEVGRSNVAFLAFFVTGNHPSILSFIF